MYMNVRMWHHFDKTGACYKCPLCQKERIRQEFKYCPFCATSLDWRDTPPNFNEKLPKGVSLEEACRVWDISPKRCEQIMNSARKALSEG